MFLGLVGPLILRANNQISGEDPAYPSIPSQGEIAPQYFGKPSHVYGGVAVASDAAGNHYHATGSKIAKYNSSGVLQWSQAQSAAVDAPTGGSTTYYDRWTDDHGASEDIQLYSGFYEGDLAAFYAQRIVLDPIGNDVYVSFLDLIHRDRSVLTKFDGVTGEVEWSARVGYVPASPSATSNYVSKVVGLAVLPDQSVAVMETGIGGSVHAFTRLMIYDSDGSSRNGVPLVEKERVYLNDGDSSFRISLGVGMAVAADGTIYYATYEGDDPGIYSGADPYENHPPDFPCPSEARAALHRQSGGAGLHHERSQSLERLGNRAQRDDLHPRNRILLQRESPEKTGPRRVCSCRPFR